MKIYVNTPEEKRDLLRQSAYIHDLKCINPFQASTLMHIHLNPDLIIVEEEEDPTMEVYSKLDL